MSRLLCWLCAPAPDMGAALSQLQDGDACDDSGLPAEPPTMADVIRERKKKAGGAALGTLRRRIVAAARRPRDVRPDRSCEHARHIRAVVSRWRLAEVFLLCEQLEAGAALRDLHAQAALARAPAPALPRALARALASRWWCDVELVGAGWAVCAHRCILVARSSYFRRLLARYPPGICRVVVDGSLWGASRSELDACLRALYSGPAPPHAHHHKHCPHDWEGSGAGADLDIISGDMSNSSGATCSCEAGAGAGTGGARAAVAMETSRDSLARDMRRLMHSGELSDCRLSWGGYELAAHRVVLAARSRYFRSVMWRRSRAAGPESGSSPASGAAAAVVRVDEGVLPRRFARALLHAAYTDQVDLTLIGRTSSSPSSTTTNNSGSAWGSRSRPVSTAALDDAFQLYEIARFLEMPIVVQGCEDAIVEALSPETLPHVLRWATAPHASQWVHRQAMRYLLDEWPSIMAQGGGSGVPRAALAEVLESPFLQASEPQILRALLKWADAAPAPPAPPASPSPAEPNVVWHTAHSVSRRGRRRSVLRSCALRDTLATLLPLVRVEHLPADHEPLLQLVRRGVMPAPVMPDESSTADAWLGRGSFRPARCFLPYLDELKALLQHQSPPEAELARLRRATLSQRIPDTLYMVSNRPAPAPAPAHCDTWCVAPAARLALRARMRRLRATHAARAPRAPQPAAAGQIALRVVREMALPDSCADLLLHDMTDDDDDDDPARASHREETEWESPNERRRWEDTPPDCCRRSSGGGSSRCLSSGSLREHHDGDNPRSSACRREPSARADVSIHGRQSGSSVSTGTGLMGVGLGGGRLSSCVPDVAMAPNANTHLLAAPYCRPADYSSGILQLDLGDGATHTPRPGSRAARALAAGRERRDFRDLTAVYSSFQPRAVSPGPGVSNSNNIGSNIINGGSNLNSGGSSNLGSLVTSSGSTGSGAGSTGSGGTSTGTGSGCTSTGTGSGAGSAGRSRTLPPPGRDLPPATHRSHHAGRPRAGAALGLAHLQQAQVSLGALSPLARRPALLAAPTDYRLEPTYGGSGSASRGPSPNNYA